MSRGSVSVSGGAGVLPVEATLAAGRIPWSDLRFDERDEDGKLLVLGQGPLSTVLAATLTSSHTFVAVKQLPADTQLPPAAVEALEAEAALGKVREAVLQRVEQEVIEWEARSTSPSP